MALGFLLKPSPPLTGGLSSSKGLERILFLEEIHKEIINCENNKIAEIIK
jgi:hypothetical protein